ncbi:MAG: response regulator [Magnetococcales bacterium]|nr:response regulator [Magnetococcales bacterium]
MNTKNTVLFVDDNLTDVKIYAEKIKHKGFNVYLCRNLRNARLYIDKNSEKIAIVVIDLMFTNGDYGGLEQYNDKIKRNSMNQGQLLGAYLDEKYGNIEYIYLSYTIKAYTGNSANETQSKRLFSKDEQEHVLNHIFSVLNKPQAIVNPEQDSPSVN